MTTVAVGLNLSTSIENKYRCHRYPPGAAKISLQTYPPFLAEIEQFLAARAAPANRRMSLAKKLSCSQCVLSARPATQPSVIDRLR
jgi:hypothetical protein